jgi:RHS repeat-associated protein
VQELSGTTPTANLLTGLNLDEVFSRTDAVGARDFLVDVLGSTLALADQVGTLQTQYTYEPFGTAASSGQTSSNSQHFTGREGDAVDLYYYRARYYHPLAQRFAGEDPIAFQGGDINLYGYIGNNPLSGTDPLGLIKYTRANCVILYERPKSCDCMWKCECPPGYMLGAVRLRMIRFRGHFPKDEYVH